MIFFKIILILIVINQSAVCFKSSDFCIKPDPKLKCNEQFSYSCNDKLCAPGKEYCLTLYRLERIKPFKQSNIEFCNIVT